MSGKRWLSRFRLSWRDREGELQEEIEAHLILEAAERIESGESPDDAWRSARRDFGNVALVKEVTRAMWGWSALERLAQDLRYALRTLRRSPGFTIVAVLSLGLGIGANSAIFTFFNAVLLRPLPYPEPDRIVMVWERSTARDETVPVHPFNFIQWRDRSRSFEALALVQAIPVNSISSDGAEQLAGLWVTSDLFRVFGAAPALGRTFAPEETSAPAHRVVILSHGFWQRQFAADRAVIGKTILLNSQRQTVIGVMPAGFRVTSLDADVYLPMPLDRARPQAIGSRSFVCFGRLRPKIDLASAQAEMAVIGGQLAAQFPLDTGHTAAVVGLHDYLVKDHRRSLHLLMGVVAMVLLVACANLAGLLMARGVGRRNELAIRASLGASRARLVRQLLVESLLLSAAGGVVGLLLGTWGTQLLLILSRGAIRFGRVDEIGLDRNVVAFTLVLSVLTSLVFGLIPALDISRIDLQTALRERGRGNAGGRGHHRYRSALVVGEVALAVVLTVGAGLLLRSFSRLARVDPGFRPERVLTMRLFLPYPEAAKRADLVEQILDRVEALPDVRSAGTIQYLPIQGTSNTGFRFEGDAPREPSQSLPTDMSLVSRGYFAAMGIPLLRGRLFDSTDRIGSPRVAMINQAFQRKYFPDGDALGRRIVLAGSNEAPTGIIGIAGDIRHNGLTTEPRPTVFLPHAQSPGYIMHLVVRTAGEPAAFAAPIRRAVQEVDRTQAVTAVKTMEEYVGEALARPRLTMALFVGFAGLALLLAAIGLYGLMSYTVTQRTHEIGVRMALGAGQGAVLRMLLGRGALLAAAGLAIGIGFAFASSRLVAALLFGVTTTDPATYAGVVLVLGAVSLVAAYIPARRAARVDPMVALRHE